MNQIFSVATLVVAFLGLAIFYLRARSLFRLEDSKIQKYKLYQVRDDLVHLVAEGTLEEESHVFQYFYGAVDLLIQNTKHFNLNTLVRALKLAREKGLDPANDLELQRVRQELGQKSEEVRGVVAEFYWTMAYILEENSLFVRLVKTRFKMFLVPVLVLRSSIEGFHAAFRMRKVFLRQREACDFYKAYQHAAHAL